MLYFIHLASGMLLILLGVTIHHKRKYNWIAGYNTMTDEERKNFDVKGFARLMRTVFVISGATMMIFSTLLVRYHFINTSLLVSFIAVLGATLYLTYRSDEFDRRKVSS
uniref:DUF3784 domain-containing protein n=1 Tax=Roseihalotalea indica TaxID=2867963 RepID=A0AA49GJE9_9BACT|nr:DUF3784 domain-containing protein [Tunicatimonas sp. TK19036]